MSDSSPQDFSPIAVPSDDGQRRRTGLLVGALIVGILVLGGSGGAIAFVMQPDETGPPVPPPSPLASAVAPPPSLPVPSQPGIRPKEDLGWPDEFATFAGGEGVKMEELPGLTFNFTVPDGWDCTDVSDGGGVVHYSCGPDGRADEIGGDLIVSTCPDPCDSDQRVAQREAEEAWGLQWYRDAGYRSWAASDEIDGQQRYGLVLVGFTRSDFESRLDQKVVLRMTAPPGDRDLIQKIATSVRDAIKTEITES